MIKCAPPHYYCCNMFVIKGVRIGEVELDISPLEHTRMITSNEDIWAILIIQAAKLLLLGAPVNRRANITHLTSTLPRPTSTYCAFVGVVNASSGFVVTVHVNFIFKNNYGFGIFSYGPYTKFCYRIMTILV